MDEEFAKDLKTDIKRYLTSVGYTVIDEDEWLIDFTIAQVENHIKNATNLKIIPIALYEVEILQVCGNFLTTKKGMGQLLGHDFEQIAKKVQEGDTTVEFADAQSAEAKFDKVTKWMVGYGELSLVGFRKLVW